MIYKVSYIPGGCLGFLPSTVNYVQIYIHIFGTKLFWSPGSVGPGEINPYKNNSLYGKKTFKTYQNIIFGFPWNPKNPCMAYSPTFG